MNKIDKFFKNNPVSFSQSYLEYLGDIIENLNLKDIGRFIGILIKARECGTTVFSLTMVIAPQRLVTLQMILVLVQIPIKNLSV